MSVAGRLGKLAPKLDPRTLRLRAYLPAALPQPPASRAWDHGVKQWGDKD